MVMVMACLMARLIACLLFDDHMACWGWGPFLIACLFASSFDFMLITYA
jgi:hypothetical protein